MKDIKNGYSIRLVGPNGEVIARQSLNGLTDEDLHDEASQIETMNELIDELPEEAWESDQEEPEAVDEDDEDSNKDVIFAEDEEESGKDNV